MVWELGWFRFLTIFGEWKNAKKGDFLLQVLPDGDQTAIGDRGINLSGGFHRGIMWHPTIAFCSASQVAKSSEWHWPVLYMRIQSGAQICWGCFYRFLPTCFTMDMFPSCSS